MNGTVTVHEALDNVFWWVGCVLCGTGGVLLFLWVEWWLVEAVCKYMGWNRQLIEVAREIIVQRRKRRFAD